MVKKQIKPNAIGLSKKQFISYFAMIIIFIVIFFGVIIPFLQGNLLFLTVLSGSMSPEIKAGDMVVVKPVNPEGVNVNDIITYKQIIGDKQDQYVTHRVVNITRENGSLVFQTKGDANDNPDIYTVDEKDLIGKKIFTIPQVGYLINFVHQPIGLIIFVLIPGSILIFSEVRKIIQVTKNSHKFE